MLRTVVPDGYLQIEVEVSLGRERLDLGEVLVAVCVEVRGRCELHPVGTGSDHCYVGGRSAQSTRYDTPVGQRQAVQITASSPRCACAFGGLSGKCHFITHTSSQPVGGIHG